MTDEEQFKGGRGRLGLQFSENVVLRGEEGTPARSGGLLVALYPYRSSVYRKCDCAIKPHPSHK